MGTPTERTATRTPQRLTALLGIITASPTTAVTSTTTRSPRLATGPVGAIMATRISQQARVLLTIAVISSTRMVSPCTRVPLDTITATVTGEATTVTGEARRAAVAARGTTDTATPT